MDENAKKKALLMIPYGLFVLGARQRRQATVATVNWLTQASFKPPLVVVGIKADSTAHALVKESKNFHPLDARCGAEIDRHRVLQTRRAG